MTWRKAGCPAEIGGGECKAFFIDDVEVAVFNVEGKFYATSNICTHQRALLTEGYLEGEYIECPLHQGRFNVVTGEPEGPPVKVPLRVFPIRIENDEIQIDVGAAA